MINTPYVTRKMSSSARAYRKLFFSTGVVACRELSLLFLAVRPPELTFPVQSPSCSPMVPALLPITFQFFLVRNIAL